MALALPLRVHAAKTANTPNVLGIHVEIMMQVSKVRRKHCQTKKGQTFKITFSAILISSKFWYISEIISKSKEKSTSRYL